MGKSKSIILFCLIITGITFGSEPNDCNEVYLYGYGYDSDYNKDCRVDAADLNEIITRWMENYAPYAPEEPNLPSNPPGPVVKKCYIDGNCWAEQTATRALSYDFHRLTIGANGSIVFRYNGLKGAVDEFAIYDGVLDDANIVEHANSLPENYVATVTADAPVLWLRFEDPCSGNGYTAADSSGNNQDGTYIGDDEVGEVNLVTGFVGNAAELYGTSPVSDGNGTCIDVNDADGALELQELTVEFWFKSTTLYDATVAYPHFFQHNGGTGSSGSYGGMVVHQYPHNPADPNDPVFGLIGGGSTDYDPVFVNITDGQWHHIVFTYESIYVVPPPPCYTYDCEVLEDNPALYLRFESDDPCDWSGNNYWVQYSEEVDIETVLGSYGKAAHLNGGWIAAANQQTEPSSDPCYGDEYAFGEGNDLTVEFWLYYPPGSSVDNNAGLWNQNAKTDPNAWSPGCQRASLQGRMRMNDNRGGDGFVDTYPGAWAADANNWHHYVMIYDASDDPCYIHIEWWTDNVLYKSVTYPPATFDNYIGPVMDHIMFGCNGSRSAPNGFYREYIDEIAVYDYPLSAARINAHYNAFGPQNCDEVWDRGIFFDDSEVWTGVWRPIENTQLGEIDRNQDCLIDFYDFAEFALEWALCNDPQGGPGCVPNW
jgi:hypothetical protein